MPNQIIAAIPAKPLAGALEHLKQARAFQSRKAFPSALSFQNSRLKSSASNMYHS